MDAGRTRRGDAERDGGWGERVCAMEGDEGGDGESKGAEAWAGRASARGDALRRGSVFVDCK